MTEPLANLSDREWNIAISHLKKCRLVISADRYDAPVAVHSLIHDYFANKLLKENPLSFQEAHRRIYQHLLSNATPVSRPKDFKDVHPFYRALTHGCMGACEQECYDNVYIKRINCPDGNLSETRYASRILGALNADFVAVNCFFSDPWDKFLPGIAEPTKVDLLRRATFLLQGLGRVREAVLPIRRALSLARDMGDWATTTKVAMEVSMAEWRLGDLAAAVHSAKEAIGLAEQSGELGLKASTRIDYAYALFLSGQRDKALEKIDEAAQIGEARSEYGWMHNFRTFEILLAEAERVAWLRFMGADVEASQVEAARSEIKVAKHKLQAMEPMVGLLSSGLYRLTKGRIAIYEWLSANSRDVDMHKAEASKCIRHAYKDLSDYGEGALPFVKVSMAWLSKLNGDDADARKELNDSWRIAEQGSMAMHMTDTRLYGARLFLHDKQCRWEWNKEGEPGMTKEELHAVSTYISQYGYWRRKEELEDAMKLTS